MAKRLKIRDSIKTTILVLLLLFFVVIAVCQMYETMDPDSDKDNIILGVNGNGSEGFGSALNGKSVPMGDYVGVVSGGNFAVIDAKGDVKTTENFILSDPILHSKGNYCVVADYNSNTARLYEKGNMVTQIDTTEKIIAVTTNQNGFFAVATEEVGYNAVINVYRKNGTAIYRYRITENTFIDMDISSNNRKLIVTEADMSTGQIGSRVVVVELNVENEQMDFYIPSELYINVHFNKNSSFVLLGSENVDLYRADTKKISSIPYKGRTLVCADITTDDMICLAFKNTGEGVGSYTVEIYDKNGKLRGERSFDEEITNLCVTGSCVAVSHGDVVDILKSDGKIKKTFTTTSPVKFATAFSGGNAAVVFSGGNTTIMK